MPVGVLQPVLFIFLKKQKKRLKETLLPRMKILPPAECQKYLSFCIPNLRRDTSYSYHISFPATCYTGSPRNEYTLSYLHIICIPFTSHLALLRASSWLMGTDRTGRHIACSNCHSHKQIHPYCTICVGV